MSKFFLNKFKKVRFDLKNEKPSKPFYPFGEHPPEPQLLTHDTLPLPASPTPHPHPCHTPPTNPLTHSCFMSLFFLIQIFKKTKLPLEMSF